MLLAVLSINNHGYIDIDSHNVAGSHVGHNLLCILIICIQ